MSSTALFVGLMSGTSMDGVDAVLVDFSGNRPVLLATHSQQYDKTLQHDCRVAAHNKQLDVGDAHGLSLRIGAAFAQTANRLIEKSGISRTEIRAIGSHGQTIRHAPDANIPYSIQLGHPDVIAATTGIVTVADFRSRDMLAGGQGAPLAPAFHAYLVRDLRANTAFVNVGGIANITLIPPADAPGQVIGFDTGPGNTLLDAWCYARTGERFDQNGEFAAQGKVIEALLEFYLKDEYISRRPPKSTGPEYFNLDWAANVPQALELERFVPASVQRTLCELTAVTIADAFPARSGNYSELFICGGGAKNGLLMARLAERIAPCRLSDPAKLGAPTDWMEAMAFAWLARERLENRAGNLPSVTGADKAVVLGGVYAGEL